MVRCALQSLHTDEYVSALQSLHTDENVGMRVKIHDLLIALVQSDNVCSKTVSIRCLKLKAPHKSRTEFTERTGYVL